MPTYQCPECEAMLRRENPVAEGKKIKCPKCETIFKPTPLPEAVKAAGGPPKKAKTVKKDKPTDDEEEEVGGTYGLIEEKVEPEPETKGQKKKKDVEFGSLRDKYEKSKRGPAMARIVNLSNGMILIGLVTGILSVGGIVYGLWPFIFSETPPVGSEKTDQFITIFGSAFAVVYAGCICYGASMLHDLKSYIWSMVGTVLTAILGLSLAIACLISLGATYIAMTADPSKEEAKPPTPGTKIVAGKTSNVTKLEFELETTAKTQITLSLDPDTNYLRKNDKPARPVDLRDDIPVKVVYIPHAKRTDRGKAVTVTMHPVDGEEDSMTLAFLALFYALGLGCGVIACVVSTKTMVRLRLDSIREGFEETLIARDY